MEFGSTRYILLRGSRAKYACAPRDPDPRTVNKCQQCIASDSACGKGPFKVNTPSDPANLWKMHRRCGQLMVFCGGTGILDRGISQSLTGPEKRERWAQRESA